MGGYEKILNFKGGYDFSIFLFLRGGGWCCEKKFHIFLRISCPNLPENIIFLTDTVVHLMTLRIKDIESQRFISADDRNINNVLISFLRLTV